MARKKVFRQNLQLFTSRYQNYNFSKEIWELESKMKAKISKIKYTLNDNNNRIIGH